MLYGTFGKGREAVRTLERYLEERQDDRDAYLYAVQWIYTVHAGGAVVHSRAEDLKRARDLCGRLREGERSAAPARQAVGGLSGERETLTAENAESAEMISLRAPRAPRLNVV